MWLQAVTMLFDQVQCNIVILVSIIFWNVAMCNCNIIDDAHKECEKKNSSHGHIFLDTAHRCAFSPTLAMFHQKCKNFPTQLDRVPMSSIGEGHLPFSLHPLEQAIHPHTVHQHRTAHPCFSG